MSFFSQLNDKSIINLTPEGIFDFSPIFHRFFHEFSLKFLRSRNQDISDGKRDRIIDRKRWNFVLRIETRQFTSRRGRKSSEFSPFSSKFPPHDDVIWQVAELQRAKNDLTAEINFTKELVRRQEWSMDSARKERDGLREILETYDREEEMDVGQNNKWDILMYDKMS